MSKISEPMYFIKTMFHEDSFSNDSASLRQSWQGGSAASTDLFWRQPYNLMHDVSMNEERIMAETVSPVTAPAGWALTA